MRLLPFDLSSMRRLVGVTGLGVASVAGCWGDDGAVVGTGGAVELIKGSHRSIRMVDELVQIDQLPKGRVRARFVFWNDGPATDVEMGFPASAHGHATKLADAWLTGFRSWVDGKAVAIKRRASNDNSEHDWAGWYVKRIHFDAGQTHVVEDRYFGGGGWDTSSFQSYDYVLRTGASWKGPIGHARVVCDLSGLVAYSPYKVTPEGYERHGFVVTWDWKNLKPKEDGDIEILWYPGFRNIFVNGKPIGAHHSEEDFEFSNIGWIDGSDLPTFCVRRDHSVVIPAELVVRWLGAKLQSVGKDRFRVALGNRWAEFQTGSRFFTSSDGRKTPMEFPASVVPEHWEDGGTTHSPIHVIGFAALVEALGGKARLDKQRNQLDLWLELAKP